MQTILPRDLGRNMFGAEKSLEDYKAYLHQLTASLRLGTESGNKVEITRPRAEPHLSLSLLHPPTHTPVPYAPPPTIHRVLLASARTSDDLAAA